MNALAITTQTLQAAGLYGTLLIALSVTVTFTIYHWVLN